jgi:hypothetical protein
MSHERQAREKIQAAHPNLGTHTVRVCAAALIPFLLAAFILLGSRESQR